MTITAAGRTATTAADGSFTLTELPASSETLVSLQRSDLADGSVLVPVVVSATRNIEARLTPLGAPSSVDAGASATVRSADTFAQVSLPGAYVNASGAAVATGPVRVTLTTFDLDANAANAPGGSGSRGAIELASAQPIALFGAIELTLKDAAGNSLQLSAASPATLRIRASARLDNLPATAVLYAYDATRGRWVTGGSAVLGGSGSARYYEATVAQAGVWAAGRSSATVSLSGCVKDASGANVVGARVQLASTDHSAASVAYSNTDGSFTLGLQRGTTATVEAHLGGRASSPVPVGASEADTALSACLVLGSAGSAPQIVAQPLSQTAATGAFVTLRVDAGGSPLLTYQWKRDGANIPGATGSTLVVSALGAADDGARYVAVVTNGFGASTSAAAVLTVTPPPQPPLVSQGPAAQQVLTGASASFEVVAVSQGGSLSYQWLRNGTAIAGATAARYTTQPAMLADDGALFSVLVSSSNGTSATSGAARLTVMAPVPLALTLQPQNASVLVGQTASFTTAATGGTSAVTYQWKRNGVAIAGAVSVAYTTPLLTLGDGGAVYTVTVSSGNETATSSAATLNVTQQAVAKGFFYVDLAGTNVSGNQTFANGQKDEYGSGKLVAIDASAPERAAVVIDSSTQPIQVFFDAFDATLGNGQLRDLRQRALAYFKDGRLYSIDKFVSGTGLPQPKLLSTLQTTDVCADDYGYPLTPAAEAGSNFAAPLRTWLFVRGPGADGQCSTADDVWRAVRLDMSSGDEALTVGEPMVDIVDANGSPSGVVMRQGNQIVRVNADLGSAVAMFSVDAATLVNTGWQFGSAMPGRWVFFEGGKLWGVDLAAPSARVELLALAGGETAASAVFRSDASGAYVSVSGSAAGRVVRINDDWTIKNLVSTTLPIRSINLTPTRVIVRTTGTGAEYSSVLKGGGASTTLLPLPSGRSIYTSSTSGEVFYVTYIGPSYASYTTSIVNADGTSPEVLLETTLITTLLPMNHSVRSRWLYTSNQAYAVLLADHAQYTSPPGGGTFWALEGATRRRLVTYGQFPSEESYVYAGLDRALQYGSSGLLDLSTNTGFDVLVYKTDAPGLTRASTLAQTLGQRRSATTATKRNAAAAQRMSKGAQLSQ